MTGRHETDSADFSRTDRPRPEPQDGACVSGKGDPLAGIADDSSQADERYLTIFADETEANLRGFVELLLLAPEERDEDQLSQLMHKAHQIKGCAAVVGCSRVAAMAHAMEDVLQKRLNQSLALTETLVGALLECSDETTAFLERLRGGELGEDGFSDAVRRLIEADDALEPSGDAPAPEGVTPDETGLIQRLVDAVGPGQEGYTGRVAFRKGLQLSNYKARLVYERLLNISEVVYFRPDPESLDNLDSVDEVDFGIVSDVSADAVAASLRIAGVADSSVEPVERSAAPAAAEEPQRKNGPSGTARASRTLRIETRQLDHLMNLAGQLIVNRAKLGRAGQTIRRMNGYSEELRGLEAALDELTYISDSIRKAVTETRMVPIDPLFNLFRRVIKDTKRAAEKRIRLELLGSDTRLDKRLIDELGDPLIHLVRNAIDHGIETPKQRAAAGKDPEGTLRLEAFQEGHDVVIRVLDDGRGLDLARIRRRAFERGFIGREEADALGDAAIAAFIWKPGFSTAACVTDISGRGVGMDIVRDTIERLGGTIEVESVPGEGCTFTIRLPLTLAIVPGLLTETGGEIHAVPTKSVVEVLRVRPEDGRTIRSRRVLRFRGRPLPVIGVDEFLGMPPLQLDGTPLTVVVLTHTNQEIGLLVGRVLGEQDLVIQSIAQNYGPVPEVAGAGVLGDGRLTLILDIGALFAVRGGCGRLQPVKDGPATLDAPFASCGKGNA